MVVTAEGVDLLFFARCWGVQPKKVFDHLVRHQPGEFAWNWITNGRVHLLDLVTIRQPAMAVSLDELKAYGVDVGPVATQGLDLLVEFNSAIVASIHRVLVPHHVGE